MRTLARVVAAVAVAASVAGCGGGSDGPTEGSLEAWLAEGNFGEEPGCPVLTDDDLADLDGAETSWVGNDDDNLICIVALDSGQVATAVYAPERVADDVDLGAHLAWAVDAEEAVVVTDDVLAGDTRFVVVADAASTSATAERIGDAVLAHLASDPDDVDSIGA